MTPQTTKKVVRSKDGINLYYESTAGHNNKPTLFFVHGIGGDLDAWQYVKKPLQEKGFSTIAMDLRGHGYSSHPKLAESYKINNLLEDIAGIIEKEKAQKIVLIGHSYGATIALAFAINFPQKLKGLVVISGNHLPHHHLNSRHRQSIASNFIDILAFISPRPFRPKHSNYPPGKFHKDYEWLGLAKTIIRNSLKSYLLALKEVLNLNLENHIGKIKTPTLLIAGTHDTIVHKSIPKRMQAGINESKLKMIKGANHVVILNNHEEVSASIHNFLKTI